MLLPPTLAHMVRDGPCLSTSVTSNTTRAFDPGAPESGKLGRRVAYLDYLDSSYVYLELTTAATAFRS